MKTYKTYKQLVRECVKAKYGFYYLVKIISGEWVTLWDQGLDIEDYFVAVVTNDEIWFKNQSTFGMLSKYKTKMEALEYILDETEEENRKYDGYFSSDIEKIKRAIRKEYRKSSIASETQE